MVLRHVGAIPNARQNISSATPVQNYSRPLAIVTTLFFMWGFLTCLNDILIPHLKSIFDLSYAKVMLVQFDLGITEVKDRLQVGDQNVIQAGEKSPHEEQGCNDRQRARVILRGRRR